MLVAPKPWVVWAPVPENSAKRVRVPKAWRMAVGGFLSGKGPDPLVRSGRSCLSRRLRRSTCGVDGGVLFCGQVVPVPEGPGGLPMPAPSAWDELVRVCGIPSRHPGVRARAGGGAGRGAGSTMAGGSAEGAPGDVVGPQAAVRDPGRG